MYIYRQKLKSLDVSICPNHQSACVGFLLVLQGLQNSLRRISLLTGQPTPPNAPPQKQWFNKGQGEPRFNKPLKRPAITGRGFGLLSHK